MKQTIENQIRDLSQDVLIAANSGTYGPEECYRAIGVGDPRYGNRNVYERIDGTRFATGPDADDAPGVMRQIAHESAVSRRRQIAALEKQIPV